MIDTTHPCLAESAAAIIARQEREISALRVHLREEQEKRKRAEQAYSDLAKLAGQRINVEDLSPRPLTGRRVFVEFTFNDVHKADRLALILSVGRTIGDLIICRVATADDWDLGPRIPIPERLSTEMFR